MSFYRKKPVVIEAVQWTGTNVAEIRVFVPSEWSDAVRVDSGGGAGTPGYPRLLIGTLEGTLWASRGDWIIKGIKGEFCPCKPDIFAATYEPAEAAPKEGGGR